MKKIDQFQSVRITTLFTDIDDTITTNGQMGPAAYQALWDLKEHGIKVVPVTGRPAGWCEMIARFWPVDGIIGENGGFYFRYDHALKKMQRYFIFSEEDRKQQRAKLNAIYDEIISQVPEAALASDQFTRLCDLAIDYCEDIKALSPQQIKKMVEIFTNHGAQAKVSSIHVNGWFGDYDKLTTCKLYCLQEWGWDLKEKQNEVAFVGDSPNDEPMFAFFKNSIAVANIQSYLNQLSSLPAYITHSESGQGFVELVQLLIKG